MEKPAVSEVIVVEGRYDKNAISQVVDAAIVELGGFGVFNDTQRVALLKRLARTRGVILFTDPDGAGFLIRGRLKGMLEGGRVLHAYAPDIPGKERRKKKGGKEGKLGVEGMRPEVLLEALRKSGATIDGETTAGGDEAITKADMLDAGLVGAGSASRRAALIRELELPEHLSANALLEVLNLLFSRREFRESYCQEEEKKI